MARLVATVAAMMQSVVVGWQVYDLTHRPLDLGWVGLAQFAPAAGLTLVSGHVADRFDRRAVIIACQLLMAICSLLLFAHAHAGGRSVGPVFAVLVLFGVARAFQAPAAQAFVPHLVPAEHFENAVAWNGSVWQSGTIAGPALGGALYAALGGAAPVYLVCAGLFGIAIALTAAIHVRTGRLERRALSLETVLAGVRYVRDNPIVLGCISLDLFAVLLGGATALLPIYARDILHAGPTGLGILRAAPAVGALGMGVYLAFHPVERRIGVKMLSAVGLFGVVTVVFALSHVLQLSLLALVLLGASDMVSVVIRGTLVQIATPPEMRGRVGAVNALFIGASNELGEFESGTTAALFGTVPAAMLGGVGTCLVVLIWAIAFPELRRTDRMADALPAGEVAAR